MHVHRLLADAAALEAMLADSEISVLTDFYDNLEVVERFNERYYRRCFPKVVICGINPGKLGAGKTGVPFLDFSSLAKMLPNIDRSDLERSAQFFFEIVDHFGHEKFYSTFYVTNMSSAGYVRKGKNCNYYELPKNALDYVEARFEQLMTEIGAEVIISLSGAVKTTVEKIFRGSGIDTTFKLNHPNYCSFPTQAEKSKEAYIQLLSKYVAV